MKQGVISGEYSMGKFKSWPVVAGTLLALAVAAVPASAQRTFVSGSGTDSGSCSLAAPCRTFLYAVTQTPDHGEIAVLNTAGYGAVTITQSVSIVNPGGVEAGIAVGSGGTAITISAGASDIVALRGLTIEGAQIGARGIFVSTVGTLEIDNCVVRDFTGNAIDIEPTGTTVFRISNSIASDNGHDGILIAPSGGSGTASGVIDHVAASSNTANGIAIGGGSGPAVNISITNSLASGSGQNGIMVQSATVSVGNTTAANNGTGILASTSGTIQLTQTLVTGNTTGVSVSGGTVNTFTDNNIHLNTTNVSGTLTSVSYQ
jgi:hypothetical protein